MTTHRLVVGLSTDTLAALTARAAQEQRPRATMARILLSEALMAWRVRDRAQKVARKRGRGKA